MTEQASRDDALKAALLDEAILRRDRNSLAAFVVRAWPLVEPGTPLIWNWHLDLICQHLERVPHEVRDLVICIPPGCMKSLLVSVFWPAWLWLGKPEERLLCFANDDSLATRDSRRMREIIRSEWYKSLIAEMSKRYGIREWGLASDQDTKVNFENSPAKGVRQCLSLGSRVTGKRCDGMIIDDPLDAKEVILGEPSQVGRRIDEINDTIEKVLPTRLNNPRTSWRVIIMQRLHVNDPAARAMGRGAHSLVLPMRYTAEHPQKHALDPRKEGELLMPQRFDEHFDQTMRSHHALGEFHYASQYDQRPQSERGGLFHREWFTRTFAFDAQRHPFDEVGISVDCTFKRGAKTDYVSIQAWGRIKADRYVLDVIRERMNYPELRHAFTTFCQKWSHARFALIEEAANGAALIDDLNRSYNGIPLIPYRPKVSKYERASLAAPLWQAGLCHLPERAPWISDFVDEHVSFGPGATNDDQVDAGSQILIRWANGDTPDERLRRSFGWLDVLGASA